jgi:hypothetical protein
LCAAAWATFANINERYIRPDLDQKVHCEATNSVLRPEVPHRKPQFPPVRALRRLRLPMGIRKAISLAKQRVQSGFRSLQLGTIFGDIGADFRLEVITKISFVFLAHLFRSRLLTVLRVGSVVLDTHFANVKFSVARFARVKPP